MPPTSIFRSPQRKINWTLVAGALIVFFTVLLAVFGPWIAPQAPMQENYALEANGRIHSPPYHLLEVPGYPLGTDDFGRDNLSRILWGIRPTLTMVVIVASMRLLLGLAIGMAAGWSSGFTSRALDGVVSVALSLPVLIVAIISISAFGSQHGLWVFLIALSVNGWAEAANLIKDKTREIKDQTYIEVGRALGAGNMRILITHVLRQVLQMVWMLIAYEISSTLLVIAELGFLGYYIGGGVWIEVFDFQAINATSLPELGQILATSVKSLTEPTVLIVTGSLIFNIILGFNLIGDGLRREGTVHHTGRQIANSSLERIIVWFEWRFIPAMENWFKQRMVRYGLLVLAALLMSGLLWWNLRPRPLQVSTENQDVPGNHPWATERGNAQGTLFVPFQGPTEGTILWQARPAEGFNGGPVVAADGNLFVVGQSGTLFAFDPQGNQLWQVTLTSAPVGTPALGSQGQIFVADKNGGLSAVAHDGTPLWYFAPTYGRTGTSGPVVGRDGTIYYTRLDSVQAVSPTGDNLWYSHASDTVLDLPPRLSPAEDLALIKNSLLWTDSGSILNTDLFSQLDPDNFYTDPSFFIGANNAMYFRVGQGASRWELVDNKFVIEENTSWDARDPSLAFPFDAGVNGHGLLWLLYGNYYSLDEIIWLDLKNGNTYGMNSFIPRSANLVGMDIEDTSYLCGYRGTPVCLAFKPGQEENVWESSLPEGQARMEEYRSQIWGALAPNRLYVTTRDGYLYALGDTTVGQP